MVFNLLIVYSTVKCLLGNEITKFLLFFKEYLIKYGYLKPSPNGVVSEEERKEAIR